MVRTSSQEHEFSSYVSERPCRRFSLSEIESATKNFDEGLVIGQGGFGKVYKGLIHSGESSFSVVAMKRLDSASKQGASEFLTELNMLSELSHHHLVSLIGYCSDSKEMILVYEYMPRGTLYDLLHRIETPLTWVQRLKICIGVAQGLDYLHAGVGTHHKIIHRDVKSSNILLDENWTAKISDFGLSKIGPTNQLLSYVSTHVKGTFGYLDPEYFWTGRLTTKSDVFAFGVVLFELLSGRRAVDLSLDGECYSLANWVHECMEKRKVDQIVDSSIKLHISPKSLKEFVKIADCCLRRRRKERPTMAEVVVALQRALVLQEKYENSKPSRGIIGLTKKIRTVFFSKTEANSGISKLLPRYTKVHQHDSNELGHERICFPPSLNGLKLIDNMSSACLHTSRQSKMMYARGIRQYTLKGHLDGIIKLKGIDIEMIQKSYTI